MWNVLFLDERWDSSIINLETLHFSDHLLKILIGTLLLLLVNIIHLLVTSQGYARPLVVGDDLRKVLLLGNR